MAGTTCIRRWHRTLSVALLALLWLGAAVSRAGDGDGAGDERLPKLEREILALFEKKKNAEGAAKCRALTH